MLIKARFHARRRSRRAAGSRSLDLTSTLELEAIHNSNKPVDSEPPQVRVPDAGESRRRDADSGAQMASQN
jgi:hypothetical protein